MIAPTSRSGRPLVVARDPVLLEELARLCAAAGAHPDVTADDQSVRRHWATASCVVVADGCAEAVAALELARRRGVLLVAQGPVEVDTWRRGLAVRADSVLSLPDDQRHLIEQLSDSLDGVGSGTALTVGVIGARGGAGASTVAAGLGLVAAAAGHATMLIDVDPWGGGLELLVGCEDRPGLRWPAVAATRGRVSAQALRSALPAHERLSVLSCDRAEPPPDIEQTLDPGALRSVLDASRRGSELVLLDLPRRSDPAMAEACAAADVVLMVTTLDVRATASARILVALLRRWCSDIRLVARLHRGGGLSAESVAAAVELPLAGEIHTRRSMQRSLDDGLGPLATRRAEREFQQLLTRVRSTAAVAS